MALTDINFSQGEVQDFIVENVAGTLNPIDDILVESSSTQYLVLEIPEPASGGNIFIMSE